MAFEKPQSKSENFSFHEEWGAMGEVAGIVGEIPILPFEMLGDFVGDVVEGFSDPND